MGAFNSAVITTKGQALLAKVVAGTADFTFTNIKVGSTTLTGDLASKTSIGTVNQTSAVASVVRQNDSNVKVSASFTNSELTTGYYVKSIGLYANDPQDGEILYSISTADESTATADWMPPFNGIGSSSLEVCLVTAVSNADSVTVEVDPTAVATVSQIVNLQDQIDTLGMFVGYSDDDIYGVEVDFDNKTFTRLAGAKYLTAGEDFDNILPFGGRKKCIVTDAGKVLAYYGETGYTEGGKLLVALTVDDVEYAVGTIVQVMVEQPMYYSKRVVVSAEKAYTKRGNQGNVVRYYVSPTAKTGFKANPIFKDDNGFYQDKIYLSAYEGSVWDTSASAYFLEDEQTADFTASTGDKLSSIAGAKPASGLTQNLTRAGARALATNRGTGWRLHNIFALSVSQELMLIEYASFNMQTAIGRGVCDYTDDGATNMALNTGSTASLGNASGMADGVDGQVSVAYRGEENLWGNIWTWLDGINIKCDGVHSAYVKANGTMADNTAEGYTEMGFKLLDESSKYISAFGVAEETGNGEDLLFLPTEGLGSSTLPVGDYWWCNPAASGWMVALVGGCWIYGSYCGAWFLVVNNSSSNRYRSIGGRLLYVPQSA